MPISTARFATAHAEKYLQQLCKHWSHRFSVEVVFALDWSGIDPDET